MISFILKKNRNSFVRTNRGGFTRTTKFTNLVCGFTLLEALVATSILMVAVVAPITIAQKGLSSAVFSKSQLVASYLVQDAIEYIKNKRDFNVINSTEAVPRDWLDGLSDCTAVTGCQVDTVGGIDGSGTIAPFSQSNFLKKQADFYGYGLGEDTIFKRQILITKTITPPLNNLEAKLKVIVSWGGDSANGDSANKVDVTTYIYNY